jgi:hypothetical protein
MRNHRGSAPFGDGGRIRERADRNGMRASSAGDGNGRPRAYRRRTPTPVRWASRLSTTRAGSSRPAEAADSSRALSRSSPARPVTAARLPRARWRGRSVLVRAVRLWRTRAPRTFTEKVRYKMLRDHRPLVVTFADKAAVRDHVVARGHADLLPLAHAVLDHPDDMLDLDLPDSYVVKPTHGSGAAVVVSPDAPADAALPRPEWGWVYAHVRPEAAHPTVLRDIAAGWTSKLYGRGPNDEWAYSQIPPRIIVEEKLTGPAGGIPDDFKFFVFHGTCRYVQVDTGRFDTRTQDFYDTHWPNTSLPTPTLSEWTCTCCRSGSSSASSPATPPADTAPSTPTTGTPCSAATGPPPAATSRTPLAP